MSRETGASSLASAAEELAQSLEAKALASYEAVGADYDQGMDELRNEADGISLKLKAIEKATDDLRRWLHPVWGDLPRKVYLGVSALAGLVVGAGLIILIGSLERRSLEGTLMSLERQSAAIARDLAQFKAMAGFELIRDGDQVVMAVADGFEIERYVSVRGLIGRNLSNAYRIIQK